MGLDQFAYKTKENIKNLKESQDVELKEIWYGRKVNCLQGYFEREFSIDNCDYVEISKTTIKDIRNRTKETLNFLIESLQPGEAKSLLTKIVENPDTDTTKEEDTLLYSLSNLWKVIESDNLKLPPTDGFFYGGVNVDSFYFFDLIETLRFCDIVEKELDATNNNEEYIVYHCWY